jgi:hypothetical protein
MSNLSTQCEEVWLTFFCFFIHILVGFGRACAPVRCAHPSFWALCHAQRGAAPPSTHRSFAAPAKQKKNVSLQAQTRHMFSHWATLRPTELRCTLVSYAAPS